MNWSSWWNGFLSLFEIITLGLLVKSIWTHDVGGIFALALISAFIGVLWFASFVEK